MDEKPSRPVEDEDEEIDDSDDAVPDVLSDLMDTDAENQYNCLFDITPDPPEESDSESAEEGKKVPVEETKESDSAVNSAENSDTSMGDVVGVHPLLFPDVIRDVLNLLPAAEVESARRVCRAWNTEACTVLRTKRVVVFLDPDAVRVYNNAMRNTVDFPHAQFEFCLQDFTGLVDENLREFWTTFGPHIKRLDFRQPLLFWRDFLNVTTNHLPNLEKLCLRHLPRNVMRGMNGKRVEGYQLGSVKELRLSSIPAVHSRAVERLTDLLRVLPNLEKIELLPVKPGALKTRLSLLLIDVFSKPLVSLPHLKSIGLNLELTSTTLEQLSAQKFKFCRLDIALQNGVKATTFKELIGSLSPYLRDLKIAFPDNFASSQNFVAKTSQEPEDCIQMLRNLKFLTLDNFNGSINFVQKIPNLQSLTVNTSKLAQCIPFGFKPLNCGHGMSSTASSPQDHKLHNLKLFSIPGTSIRPQLAETMIIEGIAMCFPSLTSVYLEGVDDDGLGVIYRNLPFLFSVVFVNAKCSDQGITGIPLEICNDMLETSTYIVVQAEKYRRDLFMGSLQFLRKLQISGDKISDASIALGVVDCKNLSELKIGSPRISDSGVILITDKFHRQMDFLDVSECPNLTEQSKFYAKEKIIGSLVVAEPPAEDAPPPNKIVKTKPGNPNRGIIKLKRSSSGSSTASHSCHPTTLPTSFLFGQTANSTGAHYQAKFYGEDTEFFEEHTEDEIRGVFPGPQFPGDRNRQRIVRIREAFRRNGDFMRNLQRLGVQQFRRLYRRELNDGGLDARERAFHEGRPFNEVVRIRERDRNEIEREFRELQRLYGPPPVVPAPPRVVYADPPPPEQIELRNRVEPFVPPDDEDVDANLGGERLGDGLNNMRDPPSDEEELEEFPLGDDPFEILQVDEVELRYAAAAQDESDDEDGDMVVPDQLPEIHLAELFRLGLRPDDIEFWFRNRGLFDQDEQFENNQRGGAGAAAAGGGARAQAQVQQRIENVARNLNQDQNIGAPDDVEMAGHPGDNADDADPPGNIDNNAGVPAGPDIADAPNNDDVEVRRAELLDRIRQRNIFVLPLRPYDDLDVLREELGERLPQRNIDLRAEVVPEIPEGAGAQPDIDEPEPPGNARNEYPPQQYVDFPSPPRPHLRFENPDDVAAYLGPIPDDGDPEVRANALFQHHVLQQVLNGPSDVRRLVLQHLGDDEFE